MSSSSSLTNFDWSRGERIGEELQQSYNAYVRRRAINRLARRIAAAEKLESNVAGKWYQASENPSVFRRPFASTPDIEVNTGRRVALRRFYQKRINTRYWDNFGKARGYGSLARTALAEAGVAAGLYVLNDQLYSEDGNFLITKILLPIGAKISDAANWVWDAITGDHDESHPAPEDDPPAVGIISLGPPSSQRDASFLGVYPPVARDQHGFPNHVTHGTFQPWGS
jgi:hypothetical protein